MSVTFVAVESGDSASTWSDGKRRPKLRCRASSRRSASEFELIVFHQRLPHRQPVDFQKGVGHGSAD